MKPTLEQIKTDESVWPDGATHYSLHPDVRSNWLNNKVGAFYGFGEWVVYPQNGLLDDHLINAIPRPAKAFVPEVGVECEYSLDGINWYVCKVMMFSLHSAFMKSHKENIYYCKEYSIELCRVMFRPIKSEREKFVEAAIDCHSSVGHSDERMLNAMYDSGKFKLVEPTK